MSDIKRWTEEGVPEAMSRLIAAAQSERPSSEALARTLAAVGAIVTTASSAAAAGASLGAGGASGVVTAKSALLHVGVFKWLLLGVGLGAATVAAVEQSRPAERRAPVVSARPRSPTPSGAVGHPALRQREEEPVSVTPSPEREPLLVLPRATSKATPAPKKAKLEASPSVSEPAGSPSPPTVDSRRLAEEVRAIDSASKALSAGLWSQTLTLLDDYAAQFPERRFEPEALYLRMEALAKSGRAQEARSVANRLVTFYPKSPQSARARLLLTPTIP